MCGSTASSCSAAWTYDAKTKEIVFDDETYPTRGSNLRVYYNHRRGLSRVARCDRAHSQIWSSLSHVWPFGQSFVVMHGV
jgi:hypothetical protein